MPLALSRLAGIALFLSGLCPGLVAAQTTGTLAGTVAAEGGITLPGAFVTVIGTTPALRRETTTDEQGSFLFADLPAARYSITALATGFTITKAIEVTLVAGQTRRVVIDMRVTGVTETVTVSADKGRASTAPSMLALTPAEVSTVAGAAENVFKVLHTLPGITAVNDFDSRLSVRGGGPDQNLTVMDGVEIHNPYRLFGLTSAFNPETVEAFELTAGAFPARYGDRLSSILTIDNRAGNSARRAMGSVTLALTDANIIAEGRLPGTSQGSWLLSGRRTYYDVVAERFVDADLPSFSDLQAKAVWRVAGGGQLSVFGLKSRESTDAEFGEPERESAVIRTKARNDLVAVSWQRAFGSRVSSRTVASWYLNRDDIDFDGRFETGARRTNAPVSNNSESLSNIIFTRQLSVRDTAIRQDTTIRVGRSHLLDAGVEAHVLATQWGWRIDGERNPGVANGSSIQGGAGLPALLDSSRDSWRFGAWLSDVWMVTPWLRVEPGVRLDKTSVTGGASLSPRASLLADLTARTRLRVAGGAFTQSPGYEKLLQSDYFVNLTSENDARVGTERARHAVVGLEHTLAPGVVARVEGYYKQFRDLVIGRLETPEEVDARTSVYDFPSSLVGEVPREAQILSAPVNGGRGKAAGIEVYLARQSVSPAGRALTGWISYTRSRAEKTMYGITMPADYDRPHAFSMVANLRLNTTIEVATTVRVQSGFPYSPPVGVRVAAVQDLADADRDGNRTELIPQVSRRLLVWTFDQGGVSNLNSARLPRFSRVDVRVTFRPAWKNRRWQFYLDVINLLNANNASGFDAQLSYDPAADRPQVTYERRNSLPLLPSLGIRYKF
ncbi:MAG TPA: TonB-dependent receptor [Vicinamibacterales bacterium]|nr:TonB-dependent receptor [Vicinamibacterales bacterium]